MSEPVITRTRGLLGYHQRLPRSIARKFGYDLVPFKRRTAPARDPRTAWMEQLGVDLVLDVGANEGQFSALVRKQGYTGRIIAFEPLSAAFETLNRTHGGDRLWRGLNCALGEAEDTLEIQVAGNSMSSSFLPMLDSHVSALPDSAIIGTEAVRVARLDTVLPADTGDAQRIYLKIDAQGFEPPVLRGAGAVLERVALLELELSLAPLYAGQELAPAVMMMAAGMGFTPVWIEQGFTDEATQRMLQVDGLFVRTALLESVTDTR